ncbi:putative quinol monooxygenase [Robbsia andropogonis]|uniref:putative quinol monooxygenase n=1 Tax=Robbsia andropogonis TaxID=28092 RepID=UPI000466D9B5|nr:putative quinol monooxygenase [Robbsia andropogonis]MCP1116633.1 antibiotic biosynthesis monooxygenase [Robbsia andropogonis]MCP1126688.1 antibiotic biosynthesis monooxygenase [Robbsia andropogonis]
MTASPSHPSSADAASVFVVIAEFTVKPGAREAFLKVGAGDAEGSVSNEEGCFAFDVLVSEDDENRVTFHEVYRDRAAFETHKTQPHYKVFAEASPPLLAGAPTVRFYLSKPSKG